VKKPLVIAATLACFLVMGDRGGFGDDAVAGTLFTYYRLPPGASKQLYSGNLRICNDRGSTGSARVSVRPTGSLLLAPGSRFNEWGSTLSFANEGGGTVTIVTRSISKNNGRCPGREAK